MNETPLDVKCGLVHSIIEGNSADALHDVKLALTSFAARKKVGNVDLADEVLTEDFVERAHFRLWTGAWPRSENSQLA